MAGLFLDLKVTSKRQDIQNVLNKKAGKLLANNIDKIDSTVLKSINTAIIESRSDFIPTDDEAAQLGVGAAGSVDESKVDNAWKELLVLSRGQRAVTTFVILRGLNTTGNLALLSIVIDEKQFYEHPLCNIGIDESKNPNAEKISNIPWMEWLIEGAPVNPNFGFVPSNRGRTGEGTMVAGGVWNFRPARLGAFDRLISKIEKKVRNDIKKNIGKVL